MANDFYWDALETIGSWVGMGAAGAYSIVKWISGQKRKILTEVATLRESHEDHVDHMRDAHQENERRLIRLEEHEQNTEKRLSEMQRIIERVDGKQDKQTDLLLAIVNQRTP